MQIESVRTRLISSGMVRSKLRRPASTWATGMPSFTAVIVAATVEFTSPTTTTADGRALLKLGFQPLHDLGDLEDVRAGADFEVHLRRLGFPAPRRTTGSSSRRSAGRCG